MNASQSQRASSSPQTYRKCMEERSDDRTRERAHAKYKERTIKIKVGTHIVIYCERNGEAARDAQAWQEKKHRDAS